MWLAQGTEQPDTPLHRDLDIASGVPVQMPFDGDWTWAPERLPLSAGNVSSESSEQPLNMQQLLRDLFAYDAWATARVIESLEGKARTGDRVLELLAHTLIAKRVWLVRIACGGSDSVPIWPQLSLLECRELFSEVEFELTAFLAQPAEDWQRRAIRYQNQNGQEFVNSLAEILLHLSHHAAYHRGQIAVLMRQRGWEPVNTDYITYARQKAAHALSGPQTA